jgi:hypothetical protein
MEKTPKPQTGPKIKQITVDLPDTGFRTVLYFNRFGVERIENHFLIHFGFMNTAGDTLAAYSAMWMNDFVSASSEEWKAYLGRIGSPPERSADLGWRPPASRLNAIEVVNSCRMARRGDAAEIRCYCYSLAAAFDRQKDATEPSSIPGQPLALLQSTIEQQQLLLLSLLKKDA